MTRLAICVVALLVAGCGADPGNPGTGPASGTAGAGGFEAVGSTGLESGDGDILQQAEWILPAEGLVWRRTRLLVVLALPLEADPASLRIELNGKERTPAFLPVGLFSRRWAERTAGDDADADRPGVVRRVQAVLSHADFRQGNNELTATFQIRTEPARVQRRFVFEPGERRIICRVERMTPDGGRETGEARVVILPEDGASPVDLSAGSSHPLHPWPEPRRRSFALSRGGEAVFFLPSGSYRAVATAGPLDSVDEWRIPETGDAEHTFTLRREVDLPDTVSVDFHVHASPSIDSLVPLDERLYSFLAAGVDVIVAADHSNVTDYGPLIQTLGVAGRIAAIAGVEASMRRPSGPSWGHWNIWPLIPDVDAPPSRRGQISGHGALPAMLVPTLEAMRQGTAAATLFDEYRARGDVPVIQLNHPRGMQHNPKKKDISRTHDYFNSVGFDPATPIPEAGSDAAASGPNTPLVRPSAAGTTALDFDALELWNRSSRRLYREVRRDWFALLNQGYVRTATANTDTHTLSPELAGYPLNVVFLPPGAPAGPAVPPPVLAAAVRSGRVAGTDGPLPLIRVHAGNSSAGPGEHLAAPGGQVRVEVEIHAAGWVPVGEIRVWANGALLRRQDSADAGGRQGRGESGGRQAPQPRASLSFTVDLTRDTWLMVEVGDLEGVAEELTVPGLYGQLVPRGLALGFTNPVLVDVDGNGRFDAPGPGPLPPP